MKRGTTTSAILLTLFLVGCGGASVPVTEIPVSSDPETEIKALSQEVEQARAQKVDVLSPTWFARAAQSLDKAQEERKKGGNVKEILEYVAEGRAQLKRAEGFAKVSAATLPKAIVARDAARRAGASEFGEEYDEVEERFLEATREIEDDDLKDARQHRDAIAQAYQQLEIKAIKKNTLTMVSNRIDQAVREGAQEYAPKSLAEARVKLKETDKFISNNRYASEEINRRAQGALFAANRTVALTQYAKATQKQTPEQRALAQEAFLARARKGLRGAGDVRDQSVSQQQDFLVIQVTELQQDRDSLVERTDQLQAEKQNLSKELAELDSKRSRELAELSSSAAKLRQEKEFNELYEQVSAYFSPDEAEVYREGQQLTIRLRAIDFRKGGYMVEPQDYPLLTKVQMAIRRFGTPDVVIEGHTDSTGSEATNQALSEQRAESVRAYLLANGVVKESQITAIGKASSEPLSPNTTAKGRAMNRRIDVIIVPQQVP